MRLVHPTLVRVIEVTATLRGLLELELDPRDVDAYADAGKTRRLLREELLTDQRSPEDFLAVRVDQLLEQGWEEPKGDPGMLRALANVSPGGRGSPRGQTNTASPTRGARGRRRLSSRASLAR